MRKIKLALVGRPNVGKSALFNRICGKRIAIVDDEAGTTRDRLYGATDFFGKPIEVIDTGGLEFKDVPYREEIRRQAEIAVEEADTIIMVVDGKSGLNPLDEEVAKILRKKRVCLAVNKIDDMSKVDEIHPFYKLGISNIVPVSATQGFQIAELLETALEGVEVPVEEKETLEGIRVAIVGRPNMGKSTLLNRLLKEDRSVVSNHPGTTRDAIDATLTVNGTSFTLIDTAGIRKKNAENAVVEKFAAIRTESAIARADVCVLMLDAEEGLTAHDKRIASMIEQEGKGCILAFNKWDLVEGHRMEHCLLALRDEASFLHHCPTLFISAQKGRNLEKLFPLIEEVRRHQLLRITTGQLNKVIEKAIQIYHPPMIQAKRLRIYYMAQVETSPPTFVLFVNYPNLMLDTYKRYLMGKFRETYKFTGNPLVFVLKARKKEKCSSSPADRDS